MPHTLEMVTPHVYWLSPDSTTDRPSLGLIVGEYDTLVVDTGNSPAHANELLAALDAQKLPQPTYAMLTHWHWDHIFGGAILDLPTFAHRETQRIVRVMSELPWDDAALDQRVAEGTEIAFCRDMLRAEIPDRSDLFIRPPEFGFSDQVEIDLGGVTCVLIHVGGDHAHDSSIVLVPETRVVFLGDAIYDDLHHGPRRLTADTFLPLIDRLLALPADTFIGGHDTELVSRNDLIKERELVATIAWAVEQYGEDRKGLLAALPVLLRKPIDEDTEAMVDVLQAGKRMPTVRPLF